MSNCTSCTPETDKNVPALDSTPALDTRELGANQQKRLEQLSCPSSRILCSSLTLQRQVNASIAKFQMSRPLGKATASMTVLPRRQSLFQKGSSYQQGCSCRPLPWSSPLSQVLPACASVASLHACLTFSRLAHHPAQQLTPHDCQIR